MSGAIRQALLMSGGIGDYLHYLTRLDAWLSSSGLDREAVDVFVESTVPGAVRSLFLKACPDLRVSFVPAAVHWTKTNPLLNAERQTDRVNRPAYRYVAAQGFAITDWFLPFSCERYAADIARLSFVVDAPPPTTPYVVLAARDKGFLWWPDERLCEQLQSYVPVGVGIVHLGTSNERHGYMRDFVCADDAAQALSVSYHAALFVGTDTGTATIRELMGKQCIYCVDQFWIDELMLRYGYWNEARARSSSSVLTRSAGELLSACASAFSALRGTPVQT